MSNETGETNVSSFDFSGMELPKQSEWRCHMFGSKSSGLLWRPNKGEVPNAFWRWMQFICFGNRWVKEGWE